MVQSDTVMINQSLLLWTEKYSFVVLHGSCIMLHYVYYVFPFFILYDRVAMNSK